MRLPKEARKLSRKLFKNSFVAGRFDDERATEVLRAVLAEKPRHCLPALKNFLRLARIETARRHALVDSAVQLTPDTLQEVRQGIGKKFGSDITAEFRTDPALIGGLRIQIGSDVWDGTIRARLQRLQSQL